ncbi:probable L-type lectin-domain containing receptor kinase S.5 [Cryptomeria japonica]|uniref:probable L-type lectin-domain containing receptor kinase S.5 n=1 Tax=Cryptomeria japonica TaxID=3369 RepID=UPI0027DAAB69|nr:probable L-type lectin-domain containing receptor kinase S.5 [Cryptomeria japonica]
MSTLVKITWIFLTIPCTLFLIAEAQDVNFNFPSSDNEIQLLEDAHDPEFGQGIELTKSGVRDNLKWSVGWAVYKRPVEIWSKSCGGLACFQSYFQFQIDRGTPTKMNYYADGLTFFMAPLGSQPPLNGSGMWLGLLNKTSNGKRSTQKVAIEFDTFKNAIIDEYYGVNSNDPDDIHVGLDINNITSVKTVSLSDRLNSGGIWEVWIDYDGLLKELQVYMAHNRSNFSSPRPQYPTLNYTLNLSDFLPEKVTIGFSASTGLSNQMHKVISWNFSSQTSWGVHHKGQLSKIIASLVGVVVAILIISAVIYKLTNKKTAKSDRDPEIPNPNGFHFDKIIERVDDEMSPNRSPRVYSYEELSRATADFRQDLILGQGGFGRVYKGSLEDGETVAVKRIYRNSEEGIRQYESEIAIIDSLTHPNLVPLLGWCHNRNGELLLIYQYMPNGSLDKYLFVGQA